MSGIFVTFAAYIFKFNHKTQSCVVTKWHFIFFQSRTFCTYLQHFCPLWLVDLSDNKHTRFSQMGEENLFFLICFCCWKKIELNLKSSFPVSVILVVLTWKQEGEIPFLTSKVVHVHWAFGVCLVFSIINLNAIVMSTTLSNNINNIRTEYKQNYHLKTETGWKVMCSTVTTIP